MELWPEEDLHSQQKKQLKQAFYGGFTTLLVIMKDKISEMSEKDGVKALEDLWIQVGAFYEAESKGFNENNEGKV